MADIVVVGSLNMDLVVKAPRMPAVGETIHGEDLRTIPGGKGANQAAATAKLGGEVAMVGRVGDDAFGLRLIDNLKQFGVSTSYVHIDAEAATGTAIIIVDERGENIIIVSPGANGRVAREDIDHIDKLLDQAKYLLLQFETPLETVQYAIEMASQKKVKVILNPAPAKKVPPEILTKVDFLVPNETETKLLTGLEVKDLDSAEAAGRKLAELGISVVIITLGEKGALLVTGDEAIHIPAQKVKAVDTTAAGDAFIGGLATALVKGYDLKDAVKYASCAGTLAVTKFGAQTSLPTSEEVEIFYKK
jgi:ribokinase